MHNKICTVPKKEFAAYFSSPVAFIFLLTFLAVTLFTFFWVETFFARNIVDVRPLFEWMPLLLVFLVAALTMRIWSEERRSGTIEFLLTVPVKAHHLVLGKFFACFSLVAVALLLTAFLPISVSYMGNLDWGPVFGAYLAALLLAGAYISIGLFVSSRTDNQIVSLIITIVLCCLFYFIGSKALGSLVGGDLERFFSLIGTGARFDSINRGVIDFRDLYYYLSLIGVFLVLNLLSLESFRWSKGKVQSKHSQLRWLAGLAIVNLLAVNVWLYRSTALRMDLTEGRIYTLSPASRTILGQVQEPLLLRGYFSSKTHPLLAPLVPQVRDLLREYAVAGGDLVRVEFVDPMNHPELEKEANQKFHIKPIQFQVADRYQASLVNSYFDILVQYGDKHEVLSFRDLIEVKALQEDSIDIRLRNPQYDITRNIKRVMSGFQSIDGLFAALEAPLELRAYFSATERLPEQLREFVGGVKEIFSELSETADGKFTYQLIDPQADGGTIAGEIEQQYGFRPMVASLFDPQQFYLYMVLVGAGREVQIPLPEQFTTEAARQAIEGALKRFSPGFLRTVGMYTPPAPPQNPYMMQMGMPPQGKRFDILREKLREEHQLRVVDFASGVVPDEVDFLLVVAPEELDESAVFAIDQFLMKGGSVAVASGAFSVEREPNTISASLKSSGLEDWFAAYGLNILPKMVLDTQHEQYPVPVKRDLGGFSVEEIRMLPYPPFVDVREGGMGESGILAGLQQVTLNWPSPIEVDMEKNEGRTVKTLLSSSKNSWVTTKADVIPDFERFPQHGFPVEGARGSFPIAVVVEGSFESFFRGKDSPLLAREEEEEGDDETDEQGEDDELVVGSVIERSPESARIILLGSSEFLSDQVLQISAYTRSSGYLHSLQLVENAVDWSLEDRALLTIRSRGHFSRVILPMSDATKALWEYANYLAALFGLLLVYGAYRFVRKVRRERYDTLLQKEGA